MDSNSPLAIPDPVQKANGAFLRRRRRLAPRILRGEPGLTTAESLREATDRWLSVLWQHAVAGRFDEQVTLYATGGYGRGELAYHSDIDVLVAIHSPQLAEDDQFALAIERLMAWSRHTRVRVSHAVRSADQVREALRGDPRTAVALLDLRHLHGPRPAREPFERQFIVDYLRGDDEGRGFVHDLIESMRRRSARNGQTVYLLEPDVKNGEGGLRDLNCLGWATRVRWRLDSPDRQRADIGWSSPMQASYRRHLGELLAVRNRLHLLRGRKHERLNFRDQQALVLLEHAPVPDAPDSALELVEQVRKKAEAPCLTRGDDDEWVWAHVEAMMRDYYRRARDIATRSERLLRRWATHHRGGRRREGPFVVEGERVDLHADASFDDEMLFELLRFAADRDLLLDPQLETRLEQRVAGWPRGGDAPDKLTRRLGELLVDVDQPYRTSRRLLDLGVITRLIPEFEPLICHVQHDLYHVYTTDVHSRKCLEEGRSLLRADPQDHPWPTFCRIGAAIEDRAPFLLACFLHDVGKNRGGDHSRRGAGLVASIGPRLGLDDEQTRRLVFLVRHHLVLSTTSRRRDISDPEIIEELAAEIESVECLNQLTALTYCDMATVGPEVMNDWNATLLLELHRRIHAALTVEPPTLAARSANNRSDLRDRLAAALADHRRLDDRRLGQFVDNLPVDHLRYTRPEAMLRQYEVYTRAVEADNSIAVGSTPLPERSVTEVVVSGPDKPGTLARISGAIASVGLNIMTADIVTTDDGRMLDIFFVAHFNPRAVPPAQPRPVDAPRRLKRLETRITEVLEDRVDIDSIVRQRRNEQRLAPRPVPPVATEVTTDPEASSRYTVLEVRTHDRLGLLYAIARTLHDCQVDTRLSRIDSLGHQAIDTFYVQQLDGTPLDTPRTDEVVDTLQQALHDGQ